MCCYIKIVWGCKNQFNFFDLNIHATKKYFQLITFLSSRETSTAAVVAGWLGICMYLFRQNRLRYFCLLGRPGWRQVLQYRRLGYCSSVQQQYKQLIMCTVLYSLSQAHFDNHIISIQNRGEDCQTHHRQAQSTNIGDKFQTEKLRRKNKNQANKAKTEDLFKNQC
jgi:hypothetical protein